MSLDADRLFGRLAMRKGYVSKEQLAEAERARGGERSLGQVLHEKGWLTDQQLSDVGQALEAEVADGSMPPKPAPPKPPVPSERSESRGPAKDGRYVLGDEIARGGIGIVVAAQDRELEREVAIKLMRPNLPRDQAERFVREAKLTARLQHPHIVPVHDFGEVEGPGGRRMLLCMKRIQGRDLKTVIRSLAAGTDPGPWTRARLLRIFQDVCLGVAYAHSRGVIHRDLKPANVMVGDFGETLIVDWGLAREGAAPAREGRARVAEPSGPTDATVVAHGSSGVARSGTPELTIEGSLLGTPTYMSPEQAEGRHAETDERSDIYALGAILYEILTLRPPVAGSSSSEILERVRAGDFARPSSVADVPPELEAICLRAMALRPPARHASARELHDDVQLFLEGVRERDRRRKEALERVEAGKRRLDRARDLASAVGAASAQVRADASRMHGWATLEEKRRLWQDEDRKLALIEERLTEFTGALTEFGQALTADPECREAADGICEVHFERFLEAERERDREAMLIARKLMEAHDGRGAYRARLEAPGRLSLRALAYPCDCLAPKPGLKVTFGERGTVAWIDGRPMPGGAVTERSLPVPAMSAAFGHGPSCAARPLAGVRVAIARYEERDHRLVLGEERELGEAPLVDASLPQGSYRCVLRPPDGSGYAPVLLPVLVERGGHWTQDVRFHRHAPDGFRFVPGGPFIWGGLWAGMVHMEKRVTEDVFVARAPVTAGEWIEFLEALVAEGRRDEALAHAPGETNEKFLKLEGGTFHFSMSGPEPILTSRDLPVVGISWLDAQAYCAWRSARDGRAYRMPHEEEFEKAARGVDGRVVPYGHFHDNLYANTIGSREAGPRLLPTGSFPADVSPYDIADLGGNSATWCWNTLEAPHRTWQPIRGGAWAMSGNSSRSTTRLGHMSHHVNRFTGLRLGFAAFA